MNSIYWDSRNGKFNRKKSPLQKTVDFLKLFCFFLSIRLYLFQINIFVGTFETHHLFYLYFGCCTHSFLSIHYLYKAVRIEYIYLWFLVYNKYFYFFCFRINFYFFSKHFCFKLFYRSIYFFFKNNAFKF